MEWQSYYQRYLDFRSAISQSAVVGIVAAEVLADFPESLPVGLQEPIGEGFWAIVDPVIEALTTAEGQRPDGHQHMSPVDRTMTIDVGPAATSQDMLKTAGVDLLMSSLLLGESILPNSPTSWRFIEAARSQHLIMLFTHISEFMSESVRAICLRRPEVLKTGKTMDWKTIVELGSWDAIHSQMIEDYLYECG